jgi:hypothetical protein
MRKLRTIKCKGALYIISFILQVQYYVYGITVFSASFELTKIILQKSSPIISTMTIRVVLKKDEKSAINKSKYYNIQFFILSVINKLPKIMIKT